MLYRVIVPKKVQRDLAKIDSRYRQRILAVLTILANEPQRGKQLRGDHGGEWSYRVWPYRIIYRIKKQKLIVLIVRIGHRQGVY